ncbi:MAG: cell division protein FtsW [Candidatus Portnoybacteria bacterium RBG_13_41_18]|uniref:Probable peptidoglycan glycosyltransferase FtsW n=1 Tax=Candidatus Portnoybacteria bacterium RBG_13_41_18 TaxID=1801991 RepID=A0A1G2F939_9BACT|nr:MAG: cell division protein FtsW [Candidatus Portnoybacteria bacterium RBG_13_41_18]
MSMYTKPNLTLLAITAILIVFGLFMVTSAGAVISQERFNQSFFFAKNQILKGLLPGLLLAFLFFITPYHYWRRLAPYLFGLGLILLVLVYIPGIGLAYGGAQRWIHLGTINFQPSEIFKLFFIIFLAAFFEKAQTEKKSGGKTFIHFLLILLIIGILIGGQPDIGTLGILLITAILIYFLGRAPLKHILILSTLSILSLLLFINIFPHTLQRIQVLFNPGLDPKGIGYQMEQSLIALGSGGIFGQGLAQGKQKFLYLPQAAGDSIAAVIGEELGFIGMLFLMSLFAAFALYGLKIAKKAPDDFSRLLSAGIICLITIQAFINIMATIGLIPLTGVPLPFISYGGTSLAISLGMVGILLNISKYSKS